MEWTKVLTKHYISNGLGFREKGILVTFVCLVAHLEKHPTVGDLQFAFKSKWHQIASTFESVYGNSIDTIASKVLEDVEKAKHIRKQNRDRQRTYSKNNAKDFDARREENRIEDKIVLCKEPQNGKFLEKIKANGAYKGIDIDKELFKMDAWLLVNPHRKKTPRFIVNWLNREAEKSRVIEPQKKPEKKPNRYCTACEGTGRIKSVNGKPEIKCWCY